MDLVIFTDGASRSNPGHAAIGYQLTDGKKELEIKGEYIGVKTNNEAEYQALIMALKACKKYKPEKIEVYSDSQLMIKQLSDEWKVKHPQLQDLYGEVKRITKGYKMTYTHVRRDNPGVSKCDALANAALDLRLLPK